MTSRGTRGALPLPQWQSCEGEMLSPPLHKDGRCTAVQSKAMSLRLRNSPVFPHPALP